MTMKGTFASILCALLAVGAAACGQEETRAASLADLDKQIPRLPVGASIADVEERLGPPREPPTELEEGAESMFYSRWQLIFDPGLKARLRYYKVDNGSPNRFATSLDRKVRELKLGQSRRAIEAKIGKTETWEIRSFGEREYLWYGNGRWRLGLIDRKLASRWLAQ